MDKRQISDLAYSIACEVGPSDLQDLITAMETDPEELIYQLRGQIAELLTTRR